VADSRGLLSNDLFDDIADRDNAAQPVIVDDRKVADVLFGHRRHALFDGLVGADCERIWGHYNNDPEYDGGEYRKQPYGLTSAIYTLLFMTSSPLQWQMQYPTRKAADKFFDDQVRSRLARTDANDMLYQFDASRAYDPSPKLESIRAPLLAINSTDDQVNPPELGIAEREIGRVKRGRFVLLPITEQTRGHGTHSLPELWKQHLAELLQESAEPPK
jgi:homoserine acetyltransferase